MFTEMNVYPDLKLDCGLFVVVSVGCLWTGVMTGVGRLGSSALARPDLDQHTSRHSVISGQTASTLVLNPVTWVSTPYTEIYNIVSKLKSNCEIK